LVSLQVLSRLIVGACTHTHARTFEESGRAERFEQAQVAAEEACAKGRWQKIGTFGRPSRRYSTHTHTHTPSETAAKKARRTFRSAPPAQRATTTARFERNTLTHTHTLILYSGDSERRHPPRRRQTIPSPTHGMARLSDSHTHTHTQALAFSKHQPPEVR
jgi:hypothetical protein